MKKTLISFVIGAFLISCNTEKISEHADHITKILPDVSISGTSNLYINQNGQLMNGTLTSEHDNGSKEAHLTFEEGMIVDGSVWDEDGQLVFSYSVKDSLIVQTLFDETGEKKAESFLKDNVLQPFVINTWHNNGTPIVQYDFERLVMQTWHENGQLASEVPIIDGQMEGKGMGWHENGEPAFENSYTDDQWDGRFTSWDEDGNLIEERTYDMGMPSGTHKKWDSKGNLIEEIVYEDGKPLAINRTDTD